MVMHQTLAKTIYFLLFSSLFPLSHCPHASCPLHSCYMSDILAGLFPFHIPLWYFLRLYPYFFLQLIFHFEGNDSC